MLGRKKVIYLCFRVAYDYSSVQAFHSEWRLLVNDRVGLGKKKKKGIAYLPDLVLLARFVWRSRDKLIKLNGILHVLYCNLGIEGCC